MKINENPFKKKRGDGFVPKTLDDEKNENDIPGESLATHSLLNQNQSNDNEQQNDAIIAGTFGGSKLPMPTIDEEKPMMNTNHQQSFKISSPTNNNEMVHYEGNNDMLSFNPSGPLKQPA